MSPGGSTASRAARAGAARATTPDQGTWSRAPGLVLLLASLAAPMTAIACGACVEDRVAATYDHAVMTAAAARHHVVVFVGIDSTRGGTAIVNEVRRAAAASNGVDAASVRVSAEPSALSFAIDPAVTTPKAALAAIQTRLRAKKVALTMIRVVG